jgi:hypothetical protein
MIRIATENPVTAKDKLKMLGREWYRLLHAKLILKPNGEYIF